MAKNSDETTPEIPEAAEAPATAETPIAATQATSPVAGPTNSAGTNKGVVAAIAGGSAVVALLIGVLIGWFAFDGDGGRGHSREMDRISQQMPGGAQRDGQKGGGQKGGMMPDDGMKSGGGRGGQMMPGQGGPGGRQGGGQMMPDNSIPIEPTTPSTQATPQGLQQG